MHVTNVQSVSARNLRTTSAAMKKSKLGVNMYKTMGTLLICRSLRIDTEYL